MVKKRFKRSDDFWTRSIKRLKYFDTEITGPHF